MAEEHLDVYRQYLAKFEEKFGDVSFDETVRNSGRLITKLKYAEFIAKWKECAQLEEFLRDVASKNYTMNDAVNRQYLEACAVVLKNPKDFNII